MSADSQDRLYSDVYLPVFADELAARGYQLTPENAGRVLKVAQELRLQHDAQLQAELASGGDVLSAAERKLASISPRFANNTTPAHNNDDEAAVQYLLTARPDLVAAAASLQ